MMLRSVVLLIVLTLLKINAQRSFRDDYVEAYRNIRYQLFKYLRQGDADAALRINAKLGKLQTEFPPDHPFFCDPNGPGRRSDTVPFSVHKLRPGDIDIIGALGDSLTAGNGAFATNIVEIAREYKGVSWSMGGRDTWRRFLTIPNILKVYNPELYGYPTKESVSFLRSSLFNVGEIGAMSRDLPFMADVLVKRMMSNPKVDLEKHWKLITILMGSNDFCSDMCYQRSPENILEHHDRNLTLALRTLRDKLPRTMINVVTVPSMQAILDLVGTPDECVSAQKVECSCIFGLQFQSQRTRFLEIMDQWNDVQYDVVNREEFHNKTDFTVNLQPWTKNFKFDLNKRNVSDITDLSAGDCFHLSQKGNARAANALWNNMLELEGEKSTNWPELFSVFKCPTKERPYLATRENSSGEKK